MNSSYPSHTSDIMPLAATVAATEWLERDVVVNIHEGLHARPAAQLVKIAKRFTADVEIQHNGQSVNAKSSARLMLLAVKEKDRIKLRARGTDAGKAIEDVAGFLDTEIDAPPAHPAAAPPARVDAKPDRQGPQAEGLVILHGVPASDGLVIGAAYPYFPPALNAPKRHIAPADRAAEAARYEAARASAINALSASRKAGNAEIVDALVEIAGDSDFAADIMTSIDAGSDAVTAVIEAGDALAHQFERSADSYIRARAEDLRGITRNIALALMGERDVSLADLPDGAIIVADELNAWDLAKAPMQRIGGMVCTRGAPNAHAAIMARNFGIPAVLGCKNLDGIAAGTTLALNGKAGTVIISPDAATRLRFEREIESFAAARAALRVYRDVAPRTADGVDIEVGANLGSATEIAAAREAGAMGVGLFRTELLFMAHNRLLSEDEQAAAYLALADAFNPSPVIIRTLDVGGDKPIPGLDIPREDNPFLGWRGLRVCLDRPDIFRPQLKALLRASIHGNLKIMLPMVCDPDEVRRSRALLNDCAAELAAAGVPHGMPELGIMMETPASVLLAHELARDVAFFSIGTNDLTQYIMAADRLNPNVAGLNRPEHAAVKRAVTMICAAARQAGIPVSVCGEAAASPDLVPVFLRAGVRKLSMSPAAIPATKKLIEGLHVHAPD